MKQRLVWYWNVALIAVIPSGCGGATTSIRAGNVSYLVSSDEASRANQELYAQPATSNERPTARCDYWTDLKSNSARDGSSNSFARWTATERDQVCSQEQTVIAQGDAARRAADEKRATSDEAARRAADASLREWKETMRVISDSETRNGKCDGARHGALEAVIHAANRIQNPIRPAVARWVSWQAGYFRSRHRGPSCPSARSLRTNCMSSSLATSIPIYMSSTEGVTKFP